MKVLLINQPWICDEKEYGLRSGVRWAMRRRRDRTMPYYSFPFPLAYATSYLLSKGISTVLRDSIALEETDAQALAFIRDERFDVVVLETATASIDYDIAFCNAVKAQNPAVVVCMTGQHSTALPEDVLKSSTADYVLIGEYDQTLLELVQALEKRESVQELAGLAFRAGDRVVNNGRQKSLAFDDLPPPFRDKALVGKYNEPVARGFPNLPMMTSRGCSFKCTFCIEAVLNYGPKSNFRYRSLDKVIDEIRTLTVEYGIKEIFFDDAFFTARRAEEVAKAILASGLQFSWSCWIDRTTTMDVLKLMKRAGCCGVKFGVETFDETIGFNARKRVIPEMVRALVKRCKELGLLTHATYVFGLPGETNESIDRTIRAAMALKTSTSQFSIATPLPGTEFFDQARQNNWLSTYDWSKYEGQSSAVLKYDHLTPKDLENAMVRVRKQKIRQLLMNPYLLVLFVYKMMKMMGVRKFIVDMSRKTRFMVRTA